MRIGPLRRIAVLWAVVLGVCSWALAASLPGTGQDEGKTVVYRDTWGVPHIYAPTVEAGLYAMGWAQAEDRPREVLTNFMRAMGESAAVEGPESTQNDLIVRLWDHYGVAQRHADRIRPEIMGQITAFVQGINDYYGAHPGDVPSWWGRRAVDVPMVLAFARLFLYSWSIDQGIEDLRRAGVELDVPETRRGSNEWAVAPSRSAEDAPILLIDPHLSWHGPSRFWEFRIHAGDLEGSGVALAGFPYIGLGHNANIAWAMTTGGPDTADVYALKLKEDDPTKYLYDGEWRELQRRDILIEVKGTTPRHFTAWQSHYGPVLAVRDGKAYAERTAYDDAVQMNEAWFEFNFATDYRGAIAAMATGQLFPQNVMVADTSGNIYYQRTGHVPVRPEGYDWSRPVDGSTSTTEWQGYHPNTDLLQVLNPPQGYMQNCNIPPDMMMPDSPFILDKTRDYLFSDASYGPRKDGWLNPRRARALEVLGSNEAVTAEQARAYALDVHPYHIERWLEVLKTANEAFGELHAADPGYERSIKEVLAWNGEIRRDSSAALKYVYWRRQLIDDYGARRVGQTAAAIDAFRSALTGQAPPPNLSGEELRAAVDAFAGAVTRMKRELATLDMTHGDLYRVGRGDLSWPCGGNGETSLGVSTLRNVDYGPPRPDGRRWGRAGQTATQVVVLTKPIQSWSAVPLGQSDRPDSPHYCDQARNLFSARKLKPTWWLPEQLQDHIESRSVLDQAP